jgi:hypothetical protein
MLHMLELTREVHDVVENDLPLAGQKLGGVIPSGVGRRAATLTKRVLPLQVEREPEIARVLYVNIPSDRDGLTG